MRLALAAAISCLLLSSLYASDKASAAITKQPTNIPAQSLESALDAFAKARHLQLVYATDDVFNLQSQGAIGDLSATDALRRLLKGTGLAYKFLDEHTVTVGPAAATTGVTPNLPIAGDGESSRGIFVAQAGQVSVGKSGEHPDQESSSEQAREKPSSDLQEILVTAQKTGSAERLQEVPIPISVMSADELLQTDQVLLSDWISSTPGVTVAQGDGLQQITIRGISTGYGSTPTVGVLIDDAPFMGDGSNSGTAQPDIDPGMLERIEVLRGPQGTLFGDGAMGGLIRYITKDPIAEGFSGQVQAGINSVYNGAQPGANVRGSLNVPFSDEFAVRVSAFARQDPGYINDVLTGKDGVNETHAYGAMITTLWKPSANISWKTNSLYQASNTDGWGNVDREVNGYQSGYGEGPSGSLPVLPHVSGLENIYNPGSGWSRWRIQFNSSTLDIKLGDVDLTSVTAYQREVYTANEDISQRFGSLFGLVDSTCGSGPNCTGAPPVGSNQLVAAEETSWTTVRRFTQELRASTPFFNDRLHWLVGAFFSTANNPSANPAWGYKFNTTQRIGPLDGFADGAVVNGANTGEGGVLAEWAAFTNFTYKITQDFDVQLGGRASRLKDSDDGNINNGGLYSLFLGGAQVTPRPLPVYSNAYTYSIAPRYRIGADTMAYIRISTGYQPGGFNTLIPVGAPGYDPAEKRIVDSSNLVNYEVGLKKDFLNHALTFDGSVYYIDWTKIQLTVINPQGIGSFTANAGKAKSEGVELELEARPATGTKISGWVSFDNAVITQSFPSDFSVFARAGDRLPFGTKYSANLAANQEFRVAGDYVGFVGAQASYVGNRYGDFTANANAPNAPPPNLPPRDFYPAYTRIDLTAGVKRGDWTATLYAKNVADSRGEVGGGAWGSPTYAYYLITPRTVGLNFIATF